MTDRVLHMWGLVFEISRMNKYVIIDSKFTEALNPSHSKERARDLTWLETTKFIKKDLWGQGQPSLWVGLLGIWWTLNVM